MGQYFRYVNHTKKEFVVLSGLRSGGDKENAVIFCGGVLAYLMMSSTYSGEVYRGSWCSKIEPKPLGSQSGEPKVDGITTAHVIHQQSVGVVGDHQVDFHDMEEYYGYKDITQEVKAEMLKTEYWPFTEEN